MISLPLLLATAALAAGPDVPASTPPAPAPAAAARREPRLGLGVELQLGVNLLANALHTYDTTFARGGNLTWQLGRLIHVDGLLLEASYLYASREGGTTSVEVASGYHQLALTPLVGWSALRWLMPYAKAGPAVFIQSARWDLDGDASDYSATRIGLLYGAGLRATLVLGGLALSGRAEVARTLRGGFADTLLTGGLGVVL